MKTKILSALAIGAALTATAANAETVHASWYGTENKFHGWQMASGPLFDMNDPEMAAHKTLPFCTQVRLLNPENGKKLTVTIVDRGPYVPGRQFDLSQAGARELGYLGSGVANLVVLETILPKASHRYGDQCDRYLG